MVGGRLLRLLLIQMQQLKVGLLAALDSMDVLLRGNRILLSGFWLLALVLMNLFTRALCEFSSASELV